MGADIHMMLEYASYRTDDGEDHWWDFGGRINPGRDYCLFGIIAGVRGDGQLYPLKGMPENLSWDGRDYFVDTESETGMASDLHSHTWFTVDEFAHCIATRMFAADYIYPIGYDVLLAAMRAFEERGVKTRLLVAFDN